MYYEINVSLNGSHLFATHKRSATDIFDCQRIYNVFVEKFPVSQGYEITVTKWESKGVSVDMGLNNG